MNVKRTYVVTYVTIKNAYNVLVHHAGYSYTIALIAARHAITFLRWRHILCDPLKSYVFCFYTMFDHTWHEWAINWRRPFWEFITLDPLEHSTIGIHVRYRPPDNVPTIPSFRPPGSRSSKFRPPGIWPPNNWQPNSNLWTLEKIGHPKIDYLISDPALGNRPPIENARTFMQGKLYIAH